MNKLQIKNHFWKLCQEADEFEKQNMNLSSLYNKTK